MEKITFNFDGNIVLSLTVFIFSSFVLLELKEVKFFESIFIFLNLSWWPTIEGSSLEGTLNLLFIGFNDRTHHMNSFTFLSRELSLNFLIVCSEATLRSIHGVLHLLAFFSKSKVEENCTLQVATSLLRVNSYQSFILS